MAWPLLARAFPHLLTGDHFLPHLGLLADHDRDHDVPPGGDGDGGCAPHGGDDARAAIRVNEAFVVKYNASSGQRLLKPHRDGASGARSGTLFSFNVALNGLEEYEGGGTYFRRLEHTGGTAAL